MLGKFIAPEPQIDQPLTHRSVLGVHQAPLDQFQQPGDAGFSFLVVLAHLPQPIAVAILAFDRRAQIVTEQAHEMLGLQYLLRHLADDDAVELIHRHAQALAAEGAFLEAGRAAVIAILPAFAGILDQGRTAIAATGDTCEQRGRVHDTRRHPFGRPALEQRLHGVEGLLVDDRRHHERHPLGRRTGPTVAAVGAVEVMQAVIGGGCQDVVDAASGEPAAPAQDAALVEPGGDGLHAHRAALGTHGHVEDHPDDTRFGVVDDQHLLVLVAASLGDLDTIAIGRARAVPEALTGILQHGAVDVFRGLAGLVLIEDVQQLAEHFARGVLADLLRDRDQFDSSFPQLADIEFRVQRVPAEPAQRMHDYEVERLVCSLGSVDHLLEDRTVFVECGSARLGEDLNDLDALSLTPYPTLGDLIRDRQVALGLTGCRHPDVNCCASHDPSPRSLRITTA